MPLCYSAHQSLSYSAYLTISVSETNLFSDSTHVLYWTSLVSSICFCISTSISPIQKVET